MEKLKVIDFDYGCGSFSKGLEDSGFFEVVYNGCLNKDNFLCYNNVHINSFSFDDVLPDRADLVVFVPDLGHNLFGAGKKNFSDVELNRMFSFLEENNSNYNNVIFVVQHSAYSLLQTYDEVLLDGDNFPTKDVISCTLINMGYSVFSYVFDGANFGLPQHNYYCVYFGSMLDTVGFFIEEDFGFGLKEYKTPNDFIGDISDSSDLTWHSPDYRRRKECSLVPPGSDAKKIKGLSQTRGYIRLYGDRVSRFLHSSFYNVSSKGPSVNPYYDRPLTLREGARLFGLSDDFIWDSHLNKKKVGEFIVESFYPLLSKKIGFKIYDIIKKK